MQHRISIGGLFKELKQQVKDFIREEAQLAKTEMTEKASKLGKNATNVAIGGFVAYAGLIVFLCALGLIVGFAFQRLGMDSSLATFVGFAIIGALVIAIGAVMALSGIKAMKKQSLAPKRTIETIHHLKGTEPMPEPEVKVEKPKVSSEQLEASVLATEEKMAETLEELTDRVTLSEFRHKADAEVRAHPYRWGLVAMGVGLAGAWLLDRKFAHGKT